MAKNLADVSKTVPSIKGELNQTGILNGYDLYSMKESPIDTPTLSQWKGGKTSQSVGLMFVSVDGVEKSTKLSIDIKGNLYQMVDVKPYSTVSVTTKNMDKSLKVTFNNKVVNFAKDKTGQVLLDVTAPRDAGTYTLKVGVSTLQLKVAKPPVAPSVAVSAGVAAKTDRTDTFPADASKKLSPIQKLWSWFLK